MNRKVRDRWVKVLRSGRYKQTDGQLGISRPDSGESFCCLGVLAKVAAAEGVIPRPQWTNRGPDRINEMYVAVSGPDGDEEEVGQLGIYLKDLGLTQSRQAALINLNDDKCASFKEIADYIEKKIPVED